MWPLQQEIRITPWSSIRKQLCACEFLLYKYIKYIIETKVSQHYIFSYCVQVTNIILFYLFHFVNVLIKTIHWFYELLMSCTPHLGKYYVRSGIWITFPNILNGDKSCKWKIFLLDYLGNLLLLLFIHCSSG